MRTSALLFLIAGCSSDQGKQQETSQSKQLKQLTELPEESLFEMAAKAETANRFGDAVKFYEAIIELHPDSPRRDKALFMAGYIKYEYLKTNDRALENFETMLQEYPNSDLVDDAEFMIKAINSGKDALTTFEETSSGN